MAKRLPRFHRRGRGKFRSRCSPNVKSRTSRKGKNKTKGTKRRRCRFVHERPHGSTGPHSLVCPMSFR